MNLKQLTLGIITGASLASMVAIEVAKAADTIFMPGLVYRTGAYAPNGIPFANGMKDYLTLINERDGGVNGVKIVHEECETGYNTKVGVECEIAVKLKKDIPYSDIFTKEDILTYIESIFPAIEIVDDRYDNWKSFTANHLIADDFFSAGCVLGREEFKVDIKNIELLRGTMYVNNKKIGEGLGKHILGNPLNALMWLASRKDIIGNFIPKNSIILLGSLVETYWVSRGDKVKINIEGMDNVSINFI